MKTLPTLALVLATSVAFAADPAFTQQAYLKASNTDLGDQFGIYVALVADSLVVGASDADTNATGVNADGGNNNSAGNAGTAYVFTLAAVPALATIATVSHTGIGLRLTIPVAAGQTVGVEYLETPAAGPWLDLGNVTVADGTGTFTESDPARRGELSGFYRAFLR